MPPFGEDVVQAVHGDGSTLEEVQAVHDDGSAVEVVQAVQGDGSTVEVVQAVHDDGSAVVVVHPVQSELVVGLASPAFCRKERGFAAARENKETSVALDPKKSDEEGIVIAK